MPVQDCHGNTAHDLCCLHGYYKCARLLKSLHWANDKNRAAEDKLYSSIAEKCRLQLYQALQVQQRWQLAKEAYKSWLDHKEVLPITPPQGCKLRSLLRVQSTLKTCVPCSQTKSQSFFSTGTGKNPRVTKIEVSTNQKERNIASVGKPEKMYPFSNYPPSKYRQCKGLPKRFLDTKPTKHVRSGSAPAAGTTNQTLDGPAGETKLHAQSAVIQPTQGERTPEFLQTPAAHDIHESKGGHLNDNDIHGQAPHDNEEGTKGTGEEARDMFIGYQNDCDRIDGLVTEDELDDSPTDDVQGDFEGVLDSLTFHEVGSENNLKSLSSPGSISPLELFHLLRMSDYDENLGRCVTSRKFKRSASVTSARQSSRTSLSRQMSLNAIPEGEMVTQYSDRTEPSQVFDEEFLYSIMPFAFSASSKDEEENSTDVMPPTSLVEVPDAENVRDSDEASPGSDLDMTASQALADSRHTTSTPTTLKVVNVTWDWDKPGVHQDVTEQAISLRGDQSLPSTHSPSPVSSPLLTSTKTRPVSLLPFASLNSLKDLETGSDSNKSLQVS